MHSVQSVRTLKPRDGPQPPWVDLHAATAPPPHRHAPEQGPSLQPQREEAEGGKMLLVLLLGCCWGRRGGKGAEAVHLLGMRRAGGGGELPPPHIPHPDLPVAAPDGQIAGGERGERRGRLLLQVEGQEVSARLAVLT